MTKTDATGATTDARALLELAGRCERSAWSQELNALIWFNLHPDKEELWGHSGMNAQRKQFKEKDLFAAFLRNPRDYGFRPDSHNYTGSIDAARPLVPEGYAWTLSTIGTGPFRYWASVGFPDEEAASYTATAATPELAFSAAALRARASLETST